MEGSGATRPSDRRTAAPPHRAAPTPHQCSNYALMVPIYIFLIGIPTSILHRKPLPPSPGAVAPPPLRSLCAQVRQIAAALAAAVRASFAASSPVEQTSRYGTAPSLSSSAYVADASDSNVQISVSPAQSRHRALHAGVVVPAGAPCLNLPPSGVPGIWGLLPH